MRTSTLDLGLRSELAVRGLRTAPPVKRHAGAGPSDDGHWTLDGRAFVVPYRPLVGALGHSDGIPAPSHELVADVTDRVARELSAGGHARLRSEAGCAACGACSALSSVGG